ncbi:MAG: hypothetical protein M3N49_10945 [Candidatus Eremiobacteraeota bacterium]|nr:hypothetical protein [Candidatus Eremiobacteraeota bacterium]
MDLIARVEQLRRHPSSVPLEADIVADLVRQAVAYMARGHDPFDVRPMLLK